MHGKVPGKIYLARVPPALYNPGALTHPRFPLAVIGTGRRGSAGQETRTHILSVARAGDSGRDCRWVVRVGKCKPPMLLQSSYPVHSSVVQVTTFIEHEGGGFAIMSLSMISFGGFRILLSTGTPLRKKAAAGSN